MLTMFRNLSALLFPDRCILCGEIVRGSAVCEACTGKLTHCADVRVCKKCSRPIPEGQLLCGNCLVAPHYFTACFAAAVYEKELRHSILKYKFYNHPEFSRGYARLIWERLLSFEVLPRFELIVCAPLSDIRLKERGYNQSELIAKELARLTGLPFCKNCVKKVRHTAAQSSLSYRMRLKNLTGAFRVEKPEDVRGKIVLLVDDVLTTGATADEISKQLLKSGAKKVYVATAAVTPLRELNTD